MLAGELWVLKSTHLEVAMVEKHWSGIAHIVARDKTLRSHHDLLYHDLLNKPQLAELRDGIKL